jgi:hypothetical protein
MAFLVRRQALSSGRLPVFLGPAALNYRQSCTKSHPSPYSVLLVLDCVQVLVSSSFIIGRSPRHRRQSPVWRRVVAGFSPRSSVRSARRHLRAKGRWARVSHAGGIGPESGQGVLERCGYRTQNPQSRRIERRPHSRETAFDLNQNQLVPLYAITGLATGRAPCDRVSTVSLPAPPRNAAWLYALPPASALPPGSPPSPGRASAPPPPGRAFH